MARIHNFNGQTRAITGGVVQTITFTAADIPSQNVVAYHLRLEGGSTFTDVSRIRVLANGAAILNMTGAQLRAYMNSFSVAGGMEPAAADDRFTIPFWMADAPTPDLQDVSQFPTESTVQVEINFAATATAGTCVIGYTVTDRPPQVFPRILSQQLNIAASVENGRFNLAENGIIRGIFLPHTGLDRFKLVLGGQEIINLPSALYNGAAGGDILAEVQRVHGGGQFIDPGFNRVSVNLPAPITSSYLELTTGATWGGVTEEAVVYAVAPNVAA